MTLLPYQVLRGDALKMLKQLPDNHFHMSVFSPPYHLIRDYGVKGQIGLESTWADFLERLLEVISEVKRVLRKDGTMWVNMGDGYAQDGKFRSDAGETRARAAIEGKYPTEAFTRVDGWQRATGSAAAFDLKPKQLLGQPWSLAFAIRESGWWLRSDIVWYKVNAMPDSAKDRPGKAHEYLFLFSPSAKYFYDEQGWRNPSGAKARTVWEIPISAKRNKGHHATYPPELPRRCVLLGTSAAGCCRRCGAPRIRNLAPTEEYKACLGTSFHDHSNDSIVGHRGTNCPRSSSYYTTTGWANSCKCNDITVPCRVLDPFSGSGTTGVVALQNGRHYTGIELNPEYHALSIKELEAAQLSVPTEEMDAGQLSLLEDLPV